VVVRGPKREIAPAWFHLQAILVGTRGSTALINGKLLELNKSESLLTAGGELQVKLVQIGRDRIVLEVEEQKLEVRLEEGTAPPKPNK
jgi:hypothetical protein